MLSSDETRAGGKRARKAKPPQDGGKAKPRKRKAAAQVPVTDQAQSAPQDIGEPVVLAETTAPATMAEIAAPVTEAASLPLPSPAETVSAVPAALEETTPVSYRALADAWGSYSRISLEQTRCYFEKLAGVRSPGAAFEVQAEFAKQACESFVAQLLRIGELQGELAKQRWQRLAGLWRR